MSTYTINHSKEINHTSSYCYCKNVLVFKLSISFPTIPDKGAKHRCKSIFNTVLGVPRCQECLENLSTSAVLLCTTRSPKALAMASLLTSVTAQPGDSYVTQGFQNLKFASEIIQLAIPHSKKTHNVWTILRLLNLLDCINAF